MEFVIFGQFLDIQLTNKNRAQPLTKISFLNYDAHCYSSHHIERFCWFMIVLILNFKKV